MRDRLASEGMFLRREHALSSRLNLKIWTWFLWSRRNNAGQRLETNSEKYLDLDIVSKQNLGEIPFRDPMTVDQGLGSQTQRGGKEHR